MKPSAALRRALATLPLVSVADTFYRVLEPGTMYGFGKGGAYTPRPLFNLGAPRNGARFTPKNGAPALYVAADLDTAMRERTGIAGRVPLRPGAALGTLLVYPVNVRLSAVLDVAEPAVQRLLGTDATELASAWRYRRDRKVPPTQRLGAAVVAAGRIEAIRYKSTKGRGHCLAIFTDALKSPSFVEVNDPVSNLTERIPPLPPGTGAPAPAPKT